MWFVLLKQCIILTLKGKPDIARPGDPLRANMEMSLISKMHFK